VHAASHLFLRSGYKDVSIRQIAQLANVSTRIVFNMLGGKERLLRACLEAIDQNKEQPLLIEQATSLDTMRRLRERQLTTLPARERTFRFPPIARSSGTPRELVTGACHGFYPLSTAWRYRDQRC